MPARKQPREDATRLVASLSVNQRPNGGARSTPAPLAPEFVARCRDSLADPRPSIPADEVRAHFEARYAADVKRGL